MFRIGLLAHGRRLPAPIECSVRKSSMEIREALYTARMTPRKLPDAIPPDIWSSLIPNASPRERSI